MLAIIRSGGKQHRVVVGQSIKVEKLGHVVGDLVTFDQVLLVADGSGQKVGNPLVGGATVKGKVLAEGKNRKILVFKQKQRKGYRRKYGHRQPWTRVEITEITAG